MRDMCNNELKVGDLVIFAQKSPVSRAGGTMSFGIISRFYNNPDGKPVCSVTTASGWKDTNIREFRIMKIESIAIQYDQIKETGDFQSFLNAMNAMRAKK